MIAELLKTEMAVKKRMMEPLQTAKLIDLLVAIAKPAEFPRRYESR